MPDTNDRLVSEKHGFIATVGTFDGVHTGHRYLLRQLLECSRRLSLAPLAIVLDPHPLQVVCPERVPPQLSDFNMRRHMIQAEGITVSRLSFDEQARRETSDEFMRRLRDELGVKGLLVGHDNRFGSDRENGFDHYLSAGEKLGIQVYEAKRLPAASSSAVRKLLCAGNIAQGNKLLGYHYGFDGKVGHGQQLGRRLGFPTANITPLDTRRLIPPAGVYATLISTDEMDFFRPSMTNIGHRPTVTGGDAPLSIETHIFDYQGDLYGRAVSLRFVCRLRDELHFSSLERLQAQLHHDAGQARSLLTQTHSIRVQQY